MATVNVHVRRQAAGDASLLSRAEVPRALSEKLHISSGCYVQIRAAADRAPRFFRAVVVADAAGDDPDADDSIVIDEWPRSSDDQDAGSSPDEFAQPAPALVAIVAPARIRVAQYVELRPAQREQPKLPLAMAKAFLKKRILHGAAGEVRFLIQGIEYGTWQFRVYYRGSARRRRRLELLASDEDLDGDSQFMPLDAGVVTDATMVTVTPVSTVTSFASAASASLQPIGAHGEPVRDLLALALFPPSSVKQGSAMQSWSLLLHGPSGSGKSTLVQLAVAELGANLLTLDASVLATPSFRIEDVFTAALRIRPSVLVLEDLELIFPRALDETKYKLVCRFLACLERIRSIAAAHVAVVGVATSVSALNANVARVFDEEMALEIPDKTWTMQLFRDLLPPSVPVSEAIQFGVAVKYGQRPSNVVSIARQITSHQSELQHLDEAALRAAIDQYGRAVAQSSSHSLRSSVPNVSWDDIGGLARVKQSLLEMVVWPLEKPHVFVRMGISPPLGMLLHGPPGTGKTMLAKAAARASGCNFLNVSASDLMRAEFGESEKAISRVFDAARALSPCMVFIDEFQSLFGNRTTAGATTSRMISQLLMEMDALKAVSEDRNFGTIKDAVAGDRVFVLAATNALNAIDPAFLQPGRFENIVYVGLPNLEERHAILELQRTKMPWCDDVDVAVLADATQGANAATLVALCQAAAIKAMQRIQGAVPEQAIGMEDFLLALETGHFEFTKSEH